MPPVHIPLPKQKTCRYFRQRCSSILLSHRMNEHTVQSKYVARSRVRFIFFFFCRSAVLFVLVSGSSCWMRRHELVKIQHLRKFEPIVYLCESLYQLSSTCPLERYITWKESIRRTHHALHVKLKALQMDRKHWRKFCEQHPFLGILFSSTDNNLQSNRAKKIDYFIKYQSEHLLVPSIVLVVSIQDLLLDVFAERIIYIFATFYVKLQRVHNAHAED